MLRGVTMVMLGVADLERSAEFYRDRLGLVLKHQSAEFAFFDGGAVTVVLSAPLGRAVQPLAGATEVIFDVASVREVYGTLIERGCVSRQGPHEVMPRTWAANLADPDGHLVTLLGAE